MRIRIAAFVAPVVLVVLVVVLMAACVPEPANRNPSNGVAAATPTVRPTPAGPTPTPSFVRPTPTPQPTFVVYVVRRGDTLTRIAKLNGTDGRSIAYWNRLAYPSLDPDSDSYRPDYVAVGWALQLIPNTVVDPEDLPPGQPTPSPEPEEPEESVIPIEG
ncbi:MAG: LysM peptidoglycan-binding domain-containing protein [Chloroflexota bacterium]|jgi:hypothetical protein